MILFTAPSGAGKTTVVHHLLDKFPFLGFSISATTRDKRKKEEEGLDYYFLDHKSFKEKIYSGEFVEWEEVYENQYYGTLKSEIERNHQAKKVVVFDIEVKGATKIKEYYGDDCMAVFIRPPSLQILIERLKNRKSEDPDSLRKRVARAREELSYEKNFDCVLVNDLLEVALLEAEVIVKDFLDIEWDGNTND